MLSCGARRLGMKTLFPPKRRNLLAVGLMRSTSLILAALVVSESIWKTSLRTKVILGIILLMIALLSWIACTREEKE